MYRALHEILSTRYWDMLPSALRGYRVELEKNISGRIPYQAEEIRTDAPFILKASDGFSERTYIKNYDYIYSEDLEDTDRVINVINIAGPVLRNGGACSYGSLSHKELLRRASDDKHVLGHIIIANTPGGNAYSKYDYEEGIAYAKSKGLPVIGLIKGMACSAGYAAMSMCDEIYSDGRHNIVGCIGSMMAGYLQKDGDVNTISQERYVEMVASQSPDKNLEHRLLAEGDYALMQAELDRLCADFHNCVMKHRPQVKSEQLTGKTYDSGDVVGTLIDGIGTMQTCISRVEKLTNRK